MSSPMHALLPCPTQRAAVDNQEATSARSAQQEQITACAITTSDGALDSEAAEGRTTSAAAAGPYHACAPAGHDPRPLQAPAAVAPAAPPPQIAGADGGEGTWGERGAAGGGGGGAASTCSSSGKRTQVPLDTDTNDGAKGGKGGYAAEGGDRDGSLDDVQGSARRDQDQQQQQQQQQQQAQPLHMEPDSGAAAKPYDRQQRQDTEARPVQEDPYRATEQLPSPFEAAAAAAAAYPPPPATSAPPDSGQGSSGPCPPHLDRDSHNGHNGHNGFDGHDHPDGHNEQQLSAALNTCQLYERYGKLFMGYRGSRRAAATFKVVAVGTTVAAALLLGMQVGCKFVVEDSQWSMHMRADRYRVCHTWWWLWSARWRRRCCWACRWAADS